MENRIEIILYLILGLGALLGNAYRSYNKKKQQEQRKQMAERNADQKYNPPPSRPKTSPMFPDLETLLGIPKEEPVEEVIPEEMQFEVMSEPSAHSKAVEEGEAVFQSTEEELVTDDLLAEDDFSITEFLQQKENENHFNYPEEEENSFEFEPLKAVLYSEILKRPEY